MAIGKQQFAQLKPDMDILVAEIRALRGVEKELAELQQCELLFANC